MASSLHVRCERKRRQPIMTRKSEYIPARRNARETESELAQRISRQLLDLVSKIPPTREAAGADADARARALTQIAANKAALAAGTLALPPGPLGWLPICRACLASMHGSIVSRCCTACSGIPRHKRCAIWW